MLVRLNGEIMEYKNILEGKFIKRPNRFIAEVEIEGKKEIAHVKNTGRCKELLKEGAKIYLEDFRNNMGTRKTAFDLISVEKETESGSLLINMDSQVPNKVIKESLENRRLILEGIQEKLIVIKPEQKYGDSRFDFYFKTEMNEGFIEVKGVTLENDGLVEFPDAPTIRGLKHINELIKAKEEGYLAYIIFLIQMEKAKTFKANEKTHKEFAEALEKAKEKGVEIMAFNCKVTETSIKLLEKVEIKINTSIIIPKE